MPARIAGVNCKGLAGPRLYPLQFQSRRSSTFGASGHSPMSPDLAGLERQITLSRADDVFGEGTMRSPQTKSSRSSVSPFNAGLAT